MNEALAQGGLRVATEPAGGQTARDERDEDDDGDRMRRPKNVQQPRGRVGWAEIIAGPYSLVARWPEIVSMQMRK